VNEHEFLRALTHNPDPAVRDKAHDLLARLDDTDGRGWNCPGCGTPLDETPEGHTRWRSGSGQWRCLDVPPDTTARLAEDAHPGHSSITTTWPIPLGTLVVIEPHTKQQEQAHVIHTTGTGPYLAVLDTHLQQHHNTHSPVDPTTRTPGCTHSAAVPVESAYDGQTLAWLCPACDQQLPENWK
jgi:hypothetical protein